MNRLYKIAVKVRFADSGSVYCAEEKLPYKVGKILGFVVSAAPQEEDARALAQAPLLRGSVSLILNGVLPIATDQPLAMPHLLERCSFKHRAFTLDEAVAVPQNSTLRLVMTGNEHFSQQAEHVKRGYLITVYLTFEPR